MQLPELERFALVGGTALALKYGHRTSIDIDLFFHEKFEHSIIIRALSDQFKEGFEYRGDNSAWGIFCFIDNIKVDIVYYPHAPLKKVELIGGIRMYSDEDIIAMKINAILGRGSKKDFWDIHELLRFYSLQQMIEFHKEKFPSQMLLISIPYAITYFHDAEDTETPLSLKNERWEDIKKNIQQKVREYLS